MKRFLQFALAMLLAMSADAQYPVALDSTKTYLVDPHGSPVFITGDTAFSLSVQLSANADIQTYLADRQAKGMNAMWMALVDNQYHDGGNTENDAFGNNPWGGGSTFTGMTSGTGPAYWSHVDYVIQQAAAYNITVIAGLAFVGTFNQCTGMYWSAISAASDSTMQAYGAFLGNRYKNQPNIIWLLGGDANLSLCGSAMATKMTDIATGILSADTNHLICIEATNSTWGEASATNWQNQSWLTLGTIYPKGNPSSTFSSEIAQIIAENGTEIAASPFLPYFSIEDPYEYEPTGAPYNNQEYRQEAYTEILAGAFLGRLFGSSGIWPFGAACCEPSGVNWKTDIDAPPSADQALLGQLFRSREHWKLRPDTNNSVLTGGYGSGAGLSVCACTSDGQTCIVYDPVGSTQPPQIAMSHFSGTVHAWWVDPNSADAASPTDLGTFSNSGAHTFTPSSTGDWVLVLDLASANLGQPLAPMAPTGLYGIAH